MLAFSAVLSLGANSLSSVLNQMCKGRGIGGVGGGGVQRRDRDRVEGLGDVVYCVNVLNNI